jgi:predicted phage terminase large subunit-like protein
MNGPLDAALRRRQLEYVVGEAAERRRRMERVLQSMRGYRNEAGEWVGGLLSFVRYFWHILEPGRKFVDGWPLEAICEHLEAVTHGEITKLLINVPPGFMKGCADSTPILTPDGYRLHGELMPGDRVFGPDGRPTRIVSRSKELVAEYDVELSTGETIKCTDDHLWRVYDRWGSAWNDDGWKIVTTKWLAEAKMDSGRNRFFIPDTGPLEFPQRDLPLHPYFLGCWLGDGTSSQPAISHDKEDRAHITKLESLGYSVKAEWKNGGNGVRSSFTRQGVQEALRAIGVLNNKHIPTEYILSSEDQRRELLAGLIDTDGSVDKKRSRVSYYTCDERLAGDVQNLVLSLGMRPYLTTMKAPGYGKYDSDKTYFIIGFQPDKSIPTALPRKQITRLDFSRRRRAILSARKSDISEPGHCITVDREDGLYVVGITNVVTHNSMLVDVFWPAWEWSSMKMPHLRYVAFSYTASLTERDNGKFRDLMAHDDFKLMYPEIRLRKTGETKVTNYAHGHKLATSIGGVGTGERGDRIILDDPHNVKESESEVVRKETVRWFHEAMHSRLNDIEKSAIVIIMQRVHENDVSGEILSKELNYLHLMIPMRFVWDANEDGEPYPTEIGWIDPRWTEDPDECDGELAWPARFPAEKVDELEDEMGPYATAGQHQQTPEPRGGGILKREFWQPWPVGKKFPAFSYIFASVDGAFTEDDHNDNDPSACTVWGIWENDEGYPRAMLVFAWEKFLAFEGQRLQPEPGEHQRDFMERQMKEWGLVEWTAHTANYWKCDRIVVEAQASGISVAQSLQARHRNRRWSVQLQDARGDKVSRAIAVQASFSQKMIYAPLERDWCQKVVNQAALFPKSKYKDLTDTVTQAVKHMRDLQLLTYDEDTRAALVAEARLENVKPKLGRLENYLPGSS